MDAFMIVLLVNGLVRVERFGSKDGHALESVEADGTPKYGM